MHWEESESCSSWRESSLRLVFCTHCVDLSWTGLDATYSWVKAGPLLVSSAGCSGTASLTTLMMIFTCTTLTVDLVLMTWLVLPASNVSDHSLLQCLQCLQTWDWVSQLSEERLVKLIWLAGRGGRVSSSSSLSTQPTSRYDNQRSQITLCSLHSDLTINCLHCSELFYQHQSWVWVCQNNQTLFSENW